MDFQQVLLTFSWFPGRWTECSTTCGPGVKNRKVECVVLQPITQNVMVWPAYECDGKNVAQSEMWLNTMY